jgi:hypothetical protein
MKNYQTEKDRLQAHIKIIVDDEYVELHHAMSVLDGSFTADQLRIIADKMDRLKWILEHEKEWIDDCRRREILAYYGKGMITKSEAFTQLHDFKLNPPDEWKDEYEKWIIEIGPNPVTFSIVA